MIKLNHSSWAGIHYCLLLLWSVAVVRAQAPQPAQKRLVTVLHPEWIFDGMDLQRGKSIALRDSLIIGVLARSQVVSLASATDSLIERDLPGKTVCPGFIEGHAHVLLHPYNETSWDDQVLRESRAERIVRATVHLQRTLQAGFTTIRDLGTEGSLFDDVGLKQSVQKGIIPGPRMIVAGRAFVATGSYGPKGYPPDFEHPVGAEEADGAETLIRAVRRQIGAGADLIKVYADYRWGVNGEARPTYSLEELKSIVETARSSGRATVAHASTQEGMHRAVEAGVETIEHGDAGTVEIFRQMAKKSVALCPTLAAGEAISMYRGWKKGVHPEPRRITEKRQNFRVALNAGVIICFGGDVGVFAHGDNAREMELMVEYGMKPLDVLRSATSVNARIFHLDSKLGRIVPDLLGDLVIVEGNPVEQIGAVRHVYSVFQNGVEVFRR